MTGRGRGRSGGPRGPPPQAYGVGRGSRGPPGAQNLRPPPPTPGAPTSRPPPPGAPSSRPPAPRRPVPANLSNIEDAESIAAGSGSTVSIQGCNHRGERCDIFRNLIPILTKGGRFCPPSQRSQVTFPRGYVPA